MKNRLCEGNALDVLKSIEKESVELIYLDPPFFTNRIHESNGIKSNKIIFSDIWLNGMNDYLDFMSEIFIQCSKIIRKTGSILLHCDYHASHYLKVELDKIFGYNNFRNEIIWKRHNSQNNFKQGAKIFGRIHDTILVYSKSKNFTWNQPFEDYTLEYIKKAYNKKDENGELYAYGDLSGPGGASKGNPFFEFLGIKRYWRYNEEKMHQLLKEGKIIQTKPGTVPKLKRYLKEMKGIPLGDIWLDISNEQTKQRKSILYPTQKPLKLLERIIRCYTNENEIVLDPFCGSGTTLVSAQQLNRKWIGIDNNPLAIKLSKHRLRNTRNYRFEIVKMDTIIHNFIEHRHHQYEAH